jgi:mRNA interferase MazF
MANRSDYRLGSIWLVKFEPSIGSEIRKTRPALIVSGSLFNDRRTKVTVLPFTSVKLDDSRISPAVIVVPFSDQNGLTVDSLLVCVDPATFDKSRLVKQLGQLEADFLEQAQATLRRYLVL